jgi:hypothetical protein
MKTTRIVVILLVLGTLLLVGCASGGGRASVGQPGYASALRPAWYDESIEEDSHNYFFYAEGEAATRTGAMQNASIGALGTISNTLGTVVLDHGRRLIAEGGLGEDASIVRATHALTETIARNMVSNARPTRTDAIQLGDNHWMGFVRYSFAKRAIFTQLADGFENDPNLRAARSAAIEARALADSLGL